MLIPSLKTPRLTLRPITMHDLNALFLLWSDESSSNFNDMIAATSIEQTRIRLIKILKDIETGRYWKWAIELDETLIGTIAIWNHDILTDSAEFGYTLRSPYRGKGYMSESLTRLLDYGHQELKINNLYVYTEVANLRSNNMMPKLGFVYQKTVDEMGHHLPQIFHYNVYLHKSDPLKLKQM